jgi:hypothetical protein
LSGATVGGAASSVAVAITVGLGVLVGGTVGVTATSPVGSTHTSGVPFGTPGVTGTIRITAPEACRHAPTGRQSTGASPARAQVRHSIERVLDKLPDRYDAAQFDQKCDHVCQHIFEAYYGDRRSLYTRAT